MYYICFNRDFYLTLCLKNTFHKFLLNLNKSLTCTVAIMHIRIIEIVKDVCIYKLLMTNDSQ